MKWISGWSNRVKFEIDSTKIDEDLTDFPVLINLDTTYSGVFNELGNNNKRIAFLHPETGEQYFCEIEYWDSVNDSAQLWVKIPTVASGINTTFYMLFDDTQADNNDYIGDVSSVTGQQVWNENFVAVYHMSQDPSIGGACILDSTLHSNHGTPYGSMTSGDLVDGVVGKAINFDGINDYIDVPNSVLGNPGTLEISFIPSTDDSTTLLLAQKDVGNYGEGAFFGKDLRWRDKGGANEYFTADPLLNSVIGKLHNWAMSFEVGNAVIYDDGNIKNVKGGLVYPPPHILVIGKGSTYRAYYKGKVSEIRYANQALTNDWIKTTNNTCRDQLLNKYPIEHNPTGVLNYKYRLKIVIPQSDVNNFLLDFPVLINLSDSSGLNKKDITHIFDELESTYNRKKIAVTDSTGINECYVEIENWDQATRSAQLWIRVPIVYSEQDTILYLYYDKTQLDNYYTVGDTNSLPAQNVWDHNFVAVYHMSQVPVDGQPSILDSTSNNNHGTPNGGMNSVNLVEGQIRKAINFDGVDDCIQTPIGLIIDSTTNTTIEYTANSDSNLNLVVGQGIGNNAIQHRILYAGVDDGTNTYVNYPITPLAGIEYNHTMTFEGNNCTIFEAGIYAANGLLNSLNNTSSYSMRIGSRNDTWRMFNGYISGVHISNTIRSDNWIKLTNNSSRDNLVIYSLEKTTSWLETYEDGELSSWKKRIKLELDHTKTDSYLIDFPILVNISDSSGYNSRDITDVFNELAPPSNVDDDFTGNDGDTPNEVFWSITSSINNAVTINTNKLRFESYDSTIFGEDATLNSLYNVSNNFSVQFYYNLISVPNTSWIIQLSVRIDSYNSGYIRRQNDNGTEEYGGRCKINGTNQTWYDSSTNNTEGYLRITRVGTVLTGFYSQDNVTWNQLWTTTIFSTKDISQISIVLYGPTNIDAIIEVDNFKVNSGTIVWSSNTNPNRKKIALTSENGTTQLPVEIENWEVTTSGTGNAQLWTKVPVVKSDEPTNLYLYYDVDKSDNTDFVGDTGEAVAQNVWDENFVAVYHMTSMDVLNSAGTELNGLPGAGITTDNISKTLIGKSIRFEATNPDNTDNYIDLGSDAFNSFQEITLECVYKATKLPSDGSSATNFHNNHNLLSKFWDGTDRSFLLKVDGTNNQVDFQLSTDVLNDNDGLIKHVNPISINTVYNIAGTWSYKTENINLIVDGILSDTAIRQGNYTRPNTSPMYIGADYYNNQDYGPTDGYIDEVRISKKAREICWIKTTNSSNIDNLTFYYDTENYIPPLPEPQYFYHGYIKEKGQPVIREVRLYERDTGKLINYTVSDSSGYYLLEAQEDKEHYITVFDNDAGDVYSPITQDKLFPNGK